MGAVPIEDVAVLLWTFNLLWYYLYLEITHPEGSIGDAHCGRLLFVVTKKIESTAFLIQSSNKIIVLKNVFRG